MSAYLSEAFLSEIVRVCDDLGYGIERLELDRIELRPLGVPEVRVLIEAELLSADTLRSVLAPSTKARKVPAWKVPA